MKIGRAKAAFAISVLAGVISMSLATSSQAATEPVAPSSQNETIYRPICWTEDGYERWLRCVAAPDGGLEIKPYRKGGPYGPLPSRRH